MTAQEIIDQFEILIEDNPDETLELQLVNDSMHAIEGDVEMEILKKLDTSLSTTAGQTYTTSKALPTDFFLPNDFLYVGTEKIYQVPIFESVNYRLNYGYFWIDLANSVYYLTGSQGSAQTITFPYFKKTDDLALGTSPVWPARFHYLIAYRMAELFYAIDQGEKSVAWDDRWSRHYQLGLNLLKQWDAKLKLQAISRQTPYGAQPSELGVNKINLG